MYQKEENMKKTNLFLMAIIGCLSMVGCREANTSTNVRNVLKEKGDVETTLIHKEQYVYALKEDQRTSREIYYYFDTDKDPETAELMLRVNTPNTGIFLSAYNEAKIGKTQKISEWHKKLAPSNGDYLYCEKEHE